MNIPPAVMKVNIDRPDKEMNLWLPLFILFPLVAVILLALFIILSPLLLIAAIVLIFLGWGRVLFVFPVALRCIAALRGFKIDVANKQEKIYISFE